MEKFLMIKSALPEQKISKYEPRLMIFDWDGFLDLSFGSFFQKVLPIHTSAEYVSSVFR